MPGLKDSTSVITSTPERNETVYTAVESVSGLVGGLATKCTGPTNSLLSTIHIWQGESATEKRIAWASVSSSNLGGHYSPHSILLSAHYDTSSALAGCHHFRFELIIFGPRAITDRLRDPVPHANHTSKRIPMRSHCRDWLTDLAHCGKNRNWVYYASRQKTLVAETP